jgi:hypothetical protein
MGEDFAAMVDTVNGRLIRRLGDGGCLGWFVEMRGSEWQGQYLQLWRKLETLEAAREEAIRLGPLPNAPEA